jgi:uncharacterized membrane protein YgcG
MNELERRIRQLLNQLSTGFSKWWNSTAARRAKLSHEATEALHDLRDSEAGKRAASALHDLRESPAGKRTAGALHDLRESPAGKRTTGALTDLRQREPLRKAEESARRALQDLRSGNGGGDSSSGGGASAS